MIFFAVAAVMIAIFSLHTFCFSDYGDTQTGTVTDHLILKRTCKGLQANCLDVDEHGVCVLFDASTKKCYDCYAVMQIKAGWFTAGSTCKMPIQEGHNSYAEAKLSAVNKHHVGSVVYPLFQTRKDPSVCHETRSVGDMLVHSMAFVMFVMLIACVGYGVVTGKLWIINY